MNPYSPSIVSGNSTDTISTRAFLQQAVDHYPRLAVFCFTLALPYRESMADYRALILRFIPKSGSVLSNIRGNASRRGVTYRPLFCAGYGRPRVRQRVGWYC
ncbi:hypothetical protein ACVQZT_004206 [Salmonella enterica subsp. enterica serovar Newport]